MNKLEGTHDAEVIKQIMHSKMFGEIKENVKLCPELIASKICVYVVSVLASSSARLKENVQSCSELTAPKI